ncbi:hypothetical protein CHS0354_014176 [Potamilus streckersoni]|uniref:E3 SUMO-protein ligase RanBP2 n=1 Tax=Potamilus streckersoni TaxID=2493646 RepID=A0AAE0VYL5_9BIVA|nr:hypothetical protein CHS0354_014176 [Potamilus streckersoni]
MAKMFKTKRDVDRHVNNLTNKLKDDKEKSSRGYQFARLYYDVGEYETAKTYLMTFLNMRETVHQAHNLLGQIYEATGQKHKALDSYKRSLLIDESQKDIVLKVCELSCSLDLDTEASKSWLEKAQKLFPNHPSVFRLKEKLMETESNGDISSLERLIKAELQANPKDVKLHIKLLRLYIKGREIDKAFDHATETEKAQTFARSLEWYECVTDVYKVYQDQHNCAGNTRFCTQKLWALSSLVFLFNSTRDVVNCSKALHQLDVALLEAHKGCSKNTGADWEEVLDEMQGQFFFHTANFLLKRAQKDQMSWKDACSFVSVCYLISAKFPAVNPKASWYIQLPRDRKEFYEQLMKVGNYRLSQGGHMLRGLCKHQEGDLWARRLQQQLCNVRSKDALYSIIFSQPDIRNAKDSSYLVQTDVFTTTSLEVPSTTLLASYDQESYKMFPDDLNQLVWLALQHYSMRDVTQPDYGFQIFQKLKFSKPDFKNSDPGSLSQLDTLVFFYATVKWVAIQQEQLKPTIYPILDKPDFLPACISPPLCTKDQCDWWSAVYKMDTNTGSRSDRVWSTVIRGLQTIRMIPPHRLPIQILFHVAHTLEERAKSIEAYSEEGHLQDTRLQAVLARAAFYWRETMSILEKLERDDYVPMPKESLFPDNSVPDTAQLQRMIEQTKFALAMVAMREGNYEEAVKGFESASSAWASYHTAKIYTQLAAQCSSGNNNGNASHEEGNFQMLALLNKARSALYITQERIGQNKQHELYNVVSQEMDDVESRIMRAESGDTLVDSLVSLATSNYSTAESDVGSELDRQSPCDQEPATLAVLQSSRDMSGLSAVENHSVRLKPSPVRFDIELKSLERRMIKFEEVFTKSNERFLDILEDLKTALKECTGVNKSIWEMMQAQKSTPPAPPRDMGTVPQHPAPPQSHQQMMMGPGYPPHPASQQSYGTQPNANYMSQYGHPFSGYYGPHRGMQPPVGFGGSTQSQRGMLHQLPEEEDMYYVDGEYYEDHGNDLQDNYQTPDSALVQDWPFGHKAGLEGKSTITYYPSGRGGQQSSSGYFANAYRGQSLQYSYQQQVSPGPAMPGPGYFSRPSTVPQPVTSQIQTTQQPPNALSTLGQVTAGTTTTSEPSAPTTSVSAPNATMPPNAVAGPSLLVKPKLIPTSLGVPVPKTTSQQQEPVKTTSVFASVSKVATTQQSDGFKQSSESGNIPTFVQQMSGGQGQASSLLSAIAAKHEQQQQQQQSQQDSKQVQGSSTSTPHVPQKPAETSTTKEQTPSKTIFGGLVFTSTPVVAEKKVEIERPKASPVSKVPAVTTSAVNPFAGFSLTPSRPSTSQPTTITNKSIGGAGDAKVPQSQASNTSYILGQGSSSATLSFGSASVQDPNAFRAKENFAGFKGAGQRLFGSASPDTNKSPAAKGGHSLTDDHDEEHIEEYEPNVDFKPIVPLPDLVEVKTGEEDEEKLFGERAKLFRFDKDSNQWKERGIGEIKILRHKVSQRVRILMRREQVLKLCANHHITKDMKLTQLPTSDRAWCWVASDYAEEEMKLEKFAVKFKTIESAERFKKIFEDCQKTLSHTVKDESTSRNQDQKTESKQNAKTGGKLSDIFKIKAGSWKCNGCLIVNEENVLKCPCCNTCKPGVKPEEIKDTKPPEDKFSIRASESGFNLPQTTQSQPNTQFKFGNSSTGTFKFGDTGDSVSAPTTQSTEFKFGNTTKPVFSFGGQTSDVTKVDTAIRTDKKEIDAKESDAKKGQKNGSLSAIFQDKSGMWKCDGCLVNNKLETSKCPCCGYLKPGIKENPGKVESFSAQTSEPGFSINGKADTSKFTFGGNQSTFTYGTPTSAQQGSSHETEKKSEMSASKPSPFIFGTSSTGSTSTPAKSEGFKFMLPVSFGTSKTESNSTSTENPFKFTFSMTPGSKSPGVTSPQSPEDSFYVNREGEDSHIYFEPIVQLPEKVDLKTGEEDENVLFEHKAKLFRFTDGQWKERGIGNIKILLNKTIQKARVLMRREHVHKICCNHYITPELDLKPMPQSKGKAWIWFAMDFTDGDPKPEQLCVKFMQPETATKFKEIFDEAKKAMNLLQSKPSPASVRVISKDDSSNDDDVAFVSEEVASPEEVQKARSFLLPDSFYLYKRCPPCPGCPGCEDYIPPQKPVACSQEESRITSTGASDTIIEKISAAKDEGKEDNTGKEETGGPYLGLFSGSTAGGISFASLAAKSGDSGYVFGRQSEGKPFHFTGAGQKLFGGLMAEKGDEDENEEGDEEVAQAEDIHFEPLVPLPALIEVKTGEEDDEVLFNTRAKLFRYEKDVNQWKEKGIGEMKILKNKLSGNYRLLLRREQVFKLACNHRLTPDLTLKPMETSETSFCWTAYDFSEGDGKIEQFAVKFKNIEIAREFKGKVDSCQVELRAQEDAKTTVDINSDKGPEIENIGASTSPPKPQRSQSILATLLTENADLNN